jgi:hypothetical protein
MGDRYLKTEEGTIRRCYPTATRAEILEKIPGRTWAQIGVHARTMGVHRTSQTWGNSIREGRKVLRDTWSRPDDERLDRVYPKHTRAQLCAAFPSRTLRGILSHAQRRHLHRTHEARGREINIGRENARKEEEERNTK